MTPAEQRARTLDRIYAGLLKKAVPVGPNLWELSDAQVNVSTRRKVYLHGRPEETRAFSFRPKSEVTGMPMDRGWILKTKNQ